MSDEVRTTLEQRGAVYGTFMDNATISEQLIEIIRNAPGYVNFQPDQRVAAWVICQKLARALSGNAQYDDNWRDMAGYAQLVVDRINGTGCYAKPAVVELQQCGGPDQLAGDCCAHCYQPVGNVHAADCPMLAL
jgi:hypothetical protein